MTYSGEYQRKRRKDGRCVTCFAKQTGERADKWRCLRCEKRQSARQRAYRERQKFSGKADRQSANAAA